MNEEEMSRGEEGEAGARSPAAVSLSTNATAFCIASLIGGAGEHGDPSVAPAWSNVAPLTTDQDAQISDSGADSNDNTSESKITGDFEPSANYRR